MKNRLTDRHSLYQMPMQDLKRKNSKKYKSRNVHKEKMESGVEKKLSSFRFGFLMGSKSKYLEGNAKIMRLNNKLKKELHQSAVTARYSNTAMQVQLSFVGPLRDSIENHE